MLWLFEVTVCALRRFGFVKRCKSEGRGAEFIVIRCVPDADGGGGREKVGAGGGAIGCRGTECERGDNGVGALLVSVGERSWERAVGALVSLMSECMNRVCVRKYGAGEIGDSESGRDTESSFAIGSLYSLGREDGGTFDGFCATRDGSAAEGRGDSGCSRAGRGLLRSTYIDGVPDPDARHWNCTGCNCAGSE